MTLRISGVEGRTLQDGPFQVENGVEVERTLVLDRGHRLKGLVLDAAGRPVADALVKARSSERGGPSFAAERRTSARGEFLFEGVPLGTVELEHFAREGVHRFVHCKIEIVVRAGENAVNLRPPQGGCSIRGTVRAEVELPDALTLSVSVPWSEREKTTFRQRDVLVQNGVFELGGLEPGTYSVHVAAQISGARWSVVLRVRLAADESRAVELVLRENRIR
jgi:hypothetical protein